MTAVMLARPDAPPVQRTSRLQTAAAWLFVLPMFAIGVVPDVTKIQGAGIVILAFAAVVIHKHPVPRRGAAVIYVTFTALSLLLILHLMFGHWPAFAGATASYDHHALIFIGMYTVVAIYAGIFYQADVFGAVMWQAARIALWAGIILCLASRLTGHLFLVNAAHGTLRMAGPLPEPSAWAAPLAVVALMAIRRRSRLYAALSLAGLALADSPTCMLVMAVTVPAYLALATRSRHRPVILAALAAVAAAAVLFVQHAPYQAYLTSGNSAEAAAGRLVSGIRNVETGGAEGQNVRFLSAQVIMGTVRENGWERYGAGLAADSTYLAAAYPGWRGPEVAANSLWLELLFDLGVGGVAVCGLLTLMAVWRMRRYPAAAALFLPFIAAVLVNSPAQDAQMVALAIMLPVPGFAVQASRSRSRPRVLTARQPG